MPTAPKRQLVPADVALIVFGTDRQRKRRASRFSSSAAKVARSAAASLGMQAIPVTTDVQRQLARQLPRGTISTKGRVDIKLVRSSLFEKLVAVAASEEGETAAPSQGSEVQSAAADSLPSENSDEWSKLARGTRVLATGADCDGAWYVAIVQHVDQSNIVLIWENWKSLGKFSRDVMQLGLLHPQHKRPY